VLGEFLKEINENPEKVNYLGMVNILIQHSQPKENYSQNDLVLQFTANFWLKTFVMLSGRTMLPFAAGILSTLLPCLAYDDERRKAIRDAALETNLTLINLIRSDDDLDVTRLQSTVG
jgi:vacuole morphology and inheritance protein 14